MHYWKVLEPVHTDNDTSSRKDVITQNRGVSSGKEDVIAQDRGVSSRKENASQPDQDAVPANKRS